MGNIEESGEGGKNEKDRIKQDIERLKGLKNKELRILVESFYDVNHPQQVRGLAP